MNNPDDALYVHSRSDPKEVRQCFFREYPSHRYYYDQLESELPQFLSNSTYIRGKAPILLNSEPAKKICVDEPWEMDRFEWRMPYSDGFNPSIVPLNDPALTPMSIGCMHDLFGKEAVGGMVLAFLRFGDSQCSYHDNAKTKEKFNINTNEWIGHGKRKGLEPTVAVFLDSNLEWVAQSIVMVELDAEWGVGKENGARVERTKMHKLSDSESGESKYKFAHVAKRLDDIRAFVRGGAIWISYYGPDHGFDNGNIVMSKVRRTNCNVTAYSPFCLTRYPPLFWTGSL